MAELPSPENSELEVKGLYFQYSCPCLSFRSKPKYLILPILVIKAPFIFLLFQDKMFKRFVKKKLGSSLRISCKVSVMVSLRLEVLFIIAENRAVREQKVNILRFYSLFLFFC